MEQFINKRKKDKFKSDFEAEIVKEDVRSEE